MLLTPHLLAGLAVAGFIPSVVAAPFYSFILYFLVEMIPHWDPDIKKSKKGEFIHYADFIISLFSFMFILIEKDLSLIYVVAGITTFVIYFFFFMLDFFDMQGKFLKKLSHSRKKIKNHDQSMWGIFIQISLCILCIAIIFQLIDFPTWQRMKKNIMVNLLGVRY